jgi:ADP-ribosylation factor protein 6
MEEAKSELSRIIQDREMRNVVLLVFANKQDVDGGKSKPPNTLAPRDFADHQFNILTAMRPNDVAQALDLDRIAKDHVWKVEPSCATSGEGKHSQITRNPHFGLKKMSSY